MEKTKKPESAEELLRKILELEQRHAHLKQEMSKRMISRTKPDHQRSNSASPVFEGGVTTDFTPGSSSLLPVIGRNHDGFEPLAMKLNETQYWNIVQSMGQAMHVFDLNGRIIFWNRASENLYGFTSDEAYGKTPTELLVEDPKDVVLADYLLTRTVQGESWSGEFPVRKKSGKNIMVIATNTPFRDENRRLIGGMCVSSDVHPYQVMRPGLTNIASPRLELVLNNKLYCLQLLQRYRILLQR